MDHGGNRRGRASADVGRRAGDGGGGGNAAEERRHDIAEPLANQLAIGLVFGAGHAVQHHSAQQGLNRPEHGHGKRRRQRACSEDQLRGEV